MLREGMRMSTEDALAIRVVLYPFEGSDIDVRTAPIMISARGANLKGSISRRISSTRLGFRALHLDRRIYNLYGMQEIQTL